MFRVSFAAFAQECRFVLCIADQLSRLTYLRGCREPQLEIDRRSPGLADAAPRIVLFGKNNDKKCAAQFSEAAASRVLIQLPPKIATSPPVSATPCHDERSIC
jgi:hypothetical protein